MPREFKVGDRVAVYVDYKGACFGVVEPDFYANENDLWVKWDAGYNHGGAISSRVHVKQCRHLKKKFTTRKKLFVVDYDNRQCRYHPNIYFDKLPDWANSENMKKFVTSYIQVKNK